MSAKPKRGDRAGAPRPALPPARCAFQPPSPGEQPRAGPCGAGGDPRYKFPASHPKFKL